MGVYALIDQQTKEISVSAMDLDVPESVINSKIGAFSKCRDNFQGATPSNRPYNISGRRNDCFMILPYKASHALIITPGRGQLDARDGPLISNLCSNSSPDLVLREHWSRRVASMTLRDHNISDNRTVQAWRRPTAIEFNIPIVRQAICDVAGINAYEKGELIFQDAGISDRFWKSLREYLLQDRFQGWLRAEKHKSLRRLTLHEVPGLLTSNPDHRNRLQFV